MKNNGMLILMYHALNTLCLYGKTPAKNMIQDTAGRKKGTQTIYILHFVIFLFNI